MKPYVLIVEDEEALSTLLEYNFEKEGYETGLAIDGEEALVMAAERSPDLILMDWMLPKLSGVEACRRLRRREDTRHTPIILLTARGDGLYGKAVFYTRAFRPRSCCAPPH